MRSVTWVAFYPKQLALCNIEEQSQRAHSVCRLIDIPAITWIPIVYTKDTPILLTGIDFAARGGAMPIHYRTLNFAVLGLFVGLTNLPVAATTAENCRQWQCDCTALPSTNLQSVCNRTQSLMLEHCIAGNIEQARFCTFYGPKTNRSFDQWLSAQLDATKNKAAAILRIKRASAEQSIVNSFLRFDQSKNALPNQAVFSDLRQLQSRFDELLDVQKQLVKTLEKETASDVIERSWEQFADLLQASAEGLKMAQEDVAAKPKKDLLIEEITNVEAGFYELAGYALDNAKQYQTAAQFWQESAAMAAKLIAMAEARGSKETADEYRYQQSTRLHRAIETMQKGTQP